MKIEFCKLGMDDNTIICQIDMMIDNRWQYGLGIAKTPKQAYYKALSKFRQSKRAYCLRRRYEHHIY